MIAPLDLPTLWEARAEEIAQDLARVGQLLSADEVRSRPGVSKRFEFLLSPLKVELDEIRNQAREKGYAADTWRRLAAFRQASLSILEDQLDFLGGAVIADRQLEPEFTRIARSWLESLCKRIDVQPITLVVGRGTRYDPDTNVACLSFLDWDIWHLPLVARAVGLSAVAPYGRLGRDVDEAVNELMTPVCQALESGSTVLASASGTWLPEVSRLLEGFRFALSEVERERYRRENKSAVKEALIRQRGQFEHLLADMLATTLLGPVYPWTLLAVELDFRLPDLLAFSG